MRKGTKGKPFCMQQTGNRRCMNPGYIEVAMVGKIKQIKHNILTIYSSFRHFLIKNKLFY